MHCVMTKARNVPSDIEVWRRRDAPHSSRPSWSRPRRRVDREVADGVEGLVPRASPFANRKRADGDLVWLEPRLVAEVSYSELMEDRLLGPSGAGASVIR